MVPEVWPGSTCRRIRATGSWRGGTVTRAYDTDTERPYYNGPCSHGVDIRHDNSWTTRYCHFQAAIGGVRPAGASLRVVWQHEERLLWARSGDEWLAFDL